MHERTQEKGFRKKFSMIILGLKLEDQENFTSNQTENICDKHCAEFIALTCI